MLWKHKSREIWLTTGDRNSRNKRKLFILALKNNEGQCFKNIKHIGDFLIKEFAKVYKAYYVGYNNQIRELIFPIILTTENEQLMAVP